MHSVLDVYGGVLQGVVPKLPRKRILTLPVDQMANG